MLLFMSSYTTMYVYIYIYIYMYCCLYISLYNRKLDSPAAACGARPAGRLNCQRISSCADTFRQLV